MSFRQRTSLLILFAALLVSAGCGPGELSRPKAKGLIEKHESFAKAVVPMFHLTPELIQKGLRQGLWTESLYTGATKSAKGLELFSEIEVNAYMPDKFVKLKNPVRREVVEMTGITAAEGDGSPNTAKIVKFTWQWDWNAVPAPVKDFLGTREQHYPATARFRLYDDGWRVEEIAFADRIGRPLPPKFE